MFTVSRKRRLWLITRVSAGCANPFLEATAQALSDLVDVGALTQAEVDTARDAFVRVWAADMLADVANGSVPFDHPSVCGLLARAVVMGVLEASMVEHARDCAMASAELEHDLSRDGADDGPVLLHETLHATLGV
jgi:hypothetical protein